MPMPMVFTTLKLFLLILLVQNTNSVSHKRGSEKRLVVIQEAHQKWVKHMGSFNHSLSQRGNNKPKPCLRIKVHKNPKKGKFVSVQEAINSLPLSISAGWLYQLVKEFTASNGRKCMEYQYSKIGYVDLSSLVNFGFGYILNENCREKVDIPASMAYVTLEGEGAEKTIIEWDDTADRKGKNGKPLGTYASATVALTLLTSLPRTLPSSTAAAIGGTGKASGGATYLGRHGSIYRLRVYRGTRHSLRSHGQALLQKLLHSGLSGFHIRKRSFAVRRLSFACKNQQFWSLDSPERGSFLEETGFSFVRCKVTGSGALYLGRAWGSFSRVVFAYTYMDKIITPKGWWNWGDKNREMTVFYGQFKCWGAGAEYGGRVSWSRELTRQEANHLSHLTSLMATTGFLISEILRFSQPHLQYSNFDCENDSLISISEQVSL
ncbi:hypothetical protein C3L33_22047, partial [Rhododendron williamsianum]